MKLNALLVKGCHNACLNVAPSPDKVGHIAFKLYFVFACLCQRRGGTRATLWNSVLVPEKGRNSGYIMELCACAREGEELWLYYGTLCLCQRRGGTLAIY